VGDTAADSTLTINPGSGNTFDYSDKISNFTVNINSDGSNGTVKFSGASTYSGATTVGGGTFDVSGSINNSATTVKNGATMKGSGSAGAVHVQSGGTLAAGDAATSLGATQAQSSNFQFTLGGITLDGGSTLSFTLDGAAPGTGSATNPAGGTMFNLGLTGSFAAGSNVTAGSILLNFNNSEVAGTPSAENVYELAAFAPASTMTLDDFKVENLDVDNGGAYSLNFVTLGNGQEALDLTVAPEPGTWMLMLSGLIFVPFAWRHLRRA
jgi:autotransporter-associated beta strand protein